MNQHLNARSSRLKGFTLIELLASVGVVVLLLALIFPAYNGVVSRARSMQCVSNLREIHGGITLFAAENDNQYPRSQTLPSGWNSEGGFWFNGIGPYLDAGRAFEKDTASAPMPQKIPFACPAVKVHGWGGAGIDIGINAYMLPAGTTNLPRVRTVQIPKPTETLLAADCWKLNKSHDEGEWAIGWAIAPNSVGEFNRASVALRHNGKANVLYFDGHIGQVSGEDLKNPEFVKRLAGTKDY